MLIRKTMQWQTLLKRKRERFFSFLTFVQGNNHRKRVKICQWWGPGELPCWPKRKAETLWSIQGGRKFLLFRNLSNLLNFSLTVLFYIDILLSRTWKKCCIFSHLTRKHQHFIWLKNLILVSEHPTALTGFQLDNIY